MAVDAVIFDWGGTLTAWHDIDFHAESLALAQAVVTTPSKDDDHHAYAARLHALDVCDRRAGEGPGRSDRQRLWQGRAPRC